MKPPGKTSTANVQTGKFAQHGLVELWMSDNIVYYEATGPFNTELVDSLAIAQRDFLLQKRPSGAWASIGILRVSALSSPDGIARYHAIMAAPKPDNMVPLATAFVIDPTVEGHIIMAPHYARIYQQINRPFRIFEQLADAQAWAQQMLDEAKT
jgi:hypothetical protein